MPKRAIKYAVIDTFTDEAYKGNPAAVCFLEDGADVDSKWMQVVAGEFNGTMVAVVSPAISAVRFDSDGQEGATACWEIDASNVDANSMQNVAKEFNVSETTFPSRPISAVGSDSNGQIGPGRFNLRWFTNITEIRLCGHCTLAATYFLLTFGIVKDDIIEFVTKSGIVTSKKIPKSMILNSEKITNGEDDKFCIELDFPVVPVTDIDVDEFPLIPLTLNGASIVNVLKSNEGDLIVEVSSAEELLNLKPNYKELEQCAGRGVVITALAHEGSEFDFFTRFFCPKIGINEDPVCGSAHCALVPYWSNKLNKKNFTVRMGSPRSGVLYLEYMEKSGRVLIRGEAVTVMMGTILA